MLPTHQVDCPSCGGVLYTALSLEDVLPANGPTSPRVEADAHGDYLRCRSYDARVPMKRITTGGGVGFRVALEAP